jgi:hypothetical protein
MGWKQAAGANGLQNGNGLKGGRSGGFKRRVFTLFSNTFKQ